MKEAIEEILEENEHVIHLWEPLEFKIDENYDYVPNNLIFSIFSNLLYYGIAFPILKLLTKIIYDLKIEGIENIKKVDGGAISVSNHVLILDCAMVGLAFGKRKIYYTTQEGSFKIPLVRKLIKYLRAVPIPENINNRKYFIKAMNNVLENGDIIHFYPEASLWPYCKKIRNFKNGAFDFAVKNNVPIIPMAYKFRKPEGYRKIFKIKPDVTLSILKPIKADMNEENIKVCIEDLKIKVKRAMEEELKAV